MILISETSAWYWDYVIEATRDASLRLSVSPTKIEFLSDIKGDEGSKVHIVTQNIDTLRILKGLSK